MFRYLVTNWRTVLYHNVGFALLSFIGYGSAAWIPAFFNRVHEWDRGDIGLRYGIIVIIFGTAGIVSGGYFSGKLARSGYKDAKMRVGLYAAIAHLPLGLLFPLVPNPWVSLLILCPAVYTMAMPFGVAPAAIQEMMPNQMRGQASAIYLFIVNLIGLGIGPTAVAYLTEDVFKDLTKVNYSLAVLSTAAGIVACILLFLGMGQFRRSLDHLDDWHASD